METKTNTPSVRLAHKLTRDHIWLNSFSKMKVYLAAQVLSESVASALEYLDQDETSETRKFLRLMEVFFDCLNTMNPIEYIRKRKANRTLYWKPDDWRFKVSNGCCTVSIICILIINLCFPCYVEWLTDTFLGYLKEWKEEANASDLSKTEKKKRTLSQETLDGLEITVRPFCELCPLLLKTTGHYILSEVLCQDPLERYFSRQRHRGGGNENPTAEQFRTNSQQLVQQQHIRHELRTMNDLPVEQDEDSHSGDQPLPKRPRRK